MKRAYAWVARLSSWTQGQTYQAADQEEVHKAHLRQEGYLTAVELLRSSLPRLPELTPAADTVSRENATRPFNPSQVLSAAEHFDSQLAAFDAQLDSIAAEHDKAMYQLPEVAAECGDADSEGSINVDLTNVGRLIARLANSGVLGSKPEGARFSFTSMPATDTLAECVLRALQLSGTRSQSSPSPQQQMDGVASSDAVQQAHAIAQAVTALSRADGENGEPSSRSRSSSRSSSLRSSRGPSGSSSMASGKDSSCRFMYDVVFRAVNVPDGPLVLVVGELKKRQKLQQCISHEPLDLAAQYDTNTTVRSIIGQVYSYMVMLHLKDAFLTTYQYTWLLSRSASDPSTLLISSAISSDDSHPQPTTMLALAWLLSRAVTDLQQAILAVSSTTDGLQGGSSGGGGCGAGAGGGGGDGRGSGANGNANPGGRNGSAGSGGGAGTNRHSGTTGADATQDSNSGAATNAQRAMGSREAGNQPHNKQMESAMSDPCGDKTSLGVQSPQPLPQVQQQQQQQQADLASTGLPVVDIRDLGVEGVELLGRSGTCIVLRGAFCGKPAAIKILDGTWENIAAVKHEARILGRLAALAGQHVPELFALGLTLGGCCCFLCTSVVPGLPLDALPRPVSPSVLSAAVSALSAVHRCGVAHGDVRADHIFVVHEDCTGSSKPRAIFVDFGGASDVVSSSDVEAERQELQEVLLELV